MRGVEHQTSRSLFLIRLEMAEFEVLEVFEEPNKIQDLLARGFGIVESEGLKGQFEVTKVAFSI